MKIGIVTTWCNRGQATVSRHVRSIFEEAGHQTFILARPLNPDLPMKMPIDTRGSWDVPRLTRGSKWEIPKDEYLAWARSTNIDVMFCDMNLQFEEVEAVRRLGVRTIGRFVWERFAKAHVAAALRAYDVVYSLTRGEQARYATMGIDSPYVRWGVPPELLAVRPSRQGEGVVFFFHGGMLGNRKPVTASVGAFLAASTNNSRLILKAQAYREGFEPPESLQDDRIDLILEDMPTDEYLDLFSSADVCLAPARWEGLGVHLYEALALGMPVIANDIPPINEVVKHGTSGLLCRSTKTGQKANGLPIYEPEVDHLRECIEELSDPGRLADLTARTLEHREQFPWDHTRGDYCALAGGATEFSMRQRRRWWHIGWS